MRNIRRLPDGDIEITELKTLEELMNESINSAYITTLDDELFLVVNLDIPEPLRLDIEPSKVFQIKPLFV